MNNHPLFELVTKAQVLEALKRLRDEGPTLPLFGICRNFAWTLGTCAEGREPSDEGEHQAMLYIREAAEAWPKHSGDVLFPVPCEDEYPEEAYDTFALWDRETQYGRDRYELLDFLIAQLEGQQS